MQQDRPALPQLPVEAVYSQLYEEGRRYREWERQAAVWSTTLLSALIAGLVALSSRSTPFMLGDGQKVFIAALLAGFAAITCLMMWFVAWRYHQIRDLLDEIEPAWKMVLVRRHLTKWPRILSPLGGQMLTVAGLATLAVFLLYTV
jgi:hypothetical protein